MSDARGESRSQPFRDDDSAPCAADVLISGICRSIRVASRRCLLDAPAITFHVGFGTDECADLLARQSMRIRISRTSLAMRRRLLPEESECTGLGGHCVSDRCRRDHLNLRSRPQLARKLEVGARQLGAFADSRQAPMPEPLSTFGSIPIPSSRNRIRSSRTSYRISTSIFLARAWRKALRRISRPIR